MTKTEKTPKKRSARVIRGSSWSRVPRELRELQDVIRDYGIPDFRYLNLGVRLVEVLNEQD